MLIPANYSDYIVNEVQYAYNNSYQNTISFLNARYTNSHATQVVMKTERVINERINDRRLVTSFYNENPEIFGLFSEISVLSEYEKMRNAFIELSFDKFYTDISKTDECLFIYGIKGNVKLFFNLFFEGTAVEALVNISTPNGKYALNGNIESCINEMSQILN